MNKFIKKLIIFTIIPLIAGVIIFVFLVNNVYSSYANCKIRNNTTSVFAGDSHIAKAVNDKIIPQSLNIATNSESFYFSFFKLKLLLKENPSIKHVYLGFSYHNLSNYYDSFIKGDFSSVIAPKYFYLLPPKEQMRLIYWNKDNLLAFTKSVIKQAIVQYLQKDSYTFMGGYSNHFNETEAVNSSMEKRIQFQFYNNGALNPFSDINISYLYHIIKLCKTRGIELTLVNTPLHLYYYELIPNEYKNKLNEIVLTNKLNYIDLSNLKFNDNCYIPDGDHVSYLGAEKTSTLLKEISPE